ncbi:hypothetical protein EMQ25_05810 [Arsenicitalea aurantiaca]|uniref:Uncharacterized protein n=1 Tax=Arsenicitalea aurantiaca TaxID=1783274 RepID=A0A433XEY6_9HYPH|nr:hypothetical protein [Arsenicitalea aurantiaca]RUT32661.1 hypothetical protein EMQ25_05810 [Arsenicitalea aurantiaca]
MQLPDLTGLPPWAAVSFGISLAVIFAFVWLGIKEGRRATPSGGSAAAQVAAVIVDSSALDRATGAVDGLTVAVTSMNVTLKLVAERYERLGDEMDKVREEMRIHREVTRRG